MVGLACAAALSSRADVLWDTYGAGYEQGYSSNPAHENAEDFVLGANSEITKANWSGAYINNTAPTDNFTVQIYGDNGGEPGASPIALLTGSLLRTDTGTQIIGREVFDYSLTLSSPLALGPGTYYFDPIDSVANDAFYWAVVSTSSGNFWVRDNPPGTWEERTSTLAFSLEGFAPLPNVAFGGLVLLGCMAGHQLVSRRRRRVVA
jgi:hypothetical protein